MINRLVDATLSAPRTVLALLVFATCCTAMGLPYSKSRPLLEGELPDTDPRVRQAREFADLHPDRNHYAIGIESTHPDGIWRFETLEKLIALTEGAAQLPGVSSTVQSLSSWNHISATEEVLTVEPLMPTVPETPAELALLRDRVRDDPLLMGRLVSRDEKMSLIRVAFGRETTGASIHRSLESLRSRYEGPERIVVFGTKHLNREIDLAMEAHLSVLLPVALAGLLLLIYGSFGHLRSVVATASLVAIVIANFLGLTGLLRIPKTVLSSVVPVLLLVVLSSSAIHLLLRIESEAKNRAWKEAIRTSLRTTGPPIALAALTSSAGFATLSAFEIYSVREFGILCSLGVALSGLMTLLWLPCLMLVLGPPPRMERSSRFPVLHWMRRLSSGAAHVSGIAPRALYVPCSILVLLIGLGTFQIQTGSNPAEFFPSDHRARADFEHLLERFEADGYFYLQISAPEGRDIFDPEFLERVDALQQSLRALPGVALASSISDTVVQRMNRVLNADQPRFERIPQSRNAIAQMVELFRWDAPETLAEMVESADPPRFLIVDVFSDVSDSAGLEDLIRSARSRIDAHFPSAQTGSVLLGGDSVRWSAQSRYLVRGKILSLFTSLVLVVLICRGVLSSWRAAILAAVPTGLGAAALFGAMGSLGIRLDLASCVITSIVVGIGVDFALHFLFRLREIEAQAAPFTARTTKALREQAIRASGPAILLDVASNCIAFGVFIASPLLPIRHFGWLICISMVSCAAATLLILPRWTRPVVSARPDVGRARPAASKPFSTSVAGG